MQVITLDEAYAPHIAEIERECFSHPWSEDGIRCHIADRNSVFLGAVQGDTLIGYGAADIIAGEGYIINVGVLPNYRRQGAAREIMRGIIEYGAESNAEFLSLEVRRSNTAAQGLYSSLGFESVGERKNFYSAPTENALIMTRYYPPRG